MYPKWIAKEAVSDSPLRWRARRFPVNTYGYHIPKIQNEIRGSVGHVCELILSDEDKGLSVQQLPLFPGPARYQLYCRNSSSESYTF
jgi:hypothetical protein